MEINQLISIFVCATRYGNHLDFGQAKHMISEFTEFSHKQYDSLEDAKADIIGALSVTELSVPFIFWNKIEGRKGHIIEDLGFFDSAGRIPIDTKLFVKWESLDGKYKVETFLVRDGKIFKNPEELNNKEKPKFYKGPYSYNPDLHTKE